MALSKLNLIVEAFFVTNPQSEKMNKKPEFMRKNHYLGFLLTTHFAKKIHVGSGSFYQALFFLYNNQTRLANKGAERILKYSVS